MQTQTAAQGNFSELGGGLSAGRGPGGGLFTTDISRFLHSDSFNLDTPLGGVQVFFDRQGFVGIGLNGPSEGLSSSFTGSDFGLSGTKVMWKGELVDLRDLLRRLTELAEKYGRELFGAPCKR